MHAYNAPYFDFCPSPEFKTEPKCTCSYNKQTRDPNHAYSLTKFLSQHSRPANIHSEPEKPLLPEMKTLQGESSVF